MLVPTFFVLDGSAPVGSGVGQVGFHSHGGTHPWVVVWCQELGSSFTELMGYR